MIYPDEEKITYSYNLGGQLEKVHGYKSYGYDYVIKIGYDKFEQRTYLKYCDGPSMLADKIFQFRYIGIKSKIIRTIKLLTYFIARTCCY